MGLLSNVSRIAGGAARRQTAGTTGRRRTGGRMGAGSGSLGRRTSGAATAGGLLSRFLRRR